MLDKPVRVVIDPMLDRLARIVIKFNITANMITLIGFCFGVAACINIAFGNFYAALILLIVNRLLDGLDGALARRTQITELGGYLDITLDFLFYSGYIFAFAVFNAEYAFYAACLIYSFLGTGVSFLTNALFLEKNADLVSEQQRKSFFYIGGLAEGTETIAVFVFITMFPEYFPTIALIFSGVCWLTTLTRLVETGLLLRNR